MKDVNPPAWVSRIGYAREFSCHPHEVGQVPIAWWTRWQIFGKAENAREIFRKPATAKLTDQEKRLKDWALLKDRY